MQIKFQFYIYKAFHKQKKKLCFVSNFIFPCFANMIQVVIIQQFLNDKHDYNINL